MKYKLLVFDWDGTLMDSQARIVDCMQAAARELEVTPPTADQVHNIIGLGLREAIEALFPDLNGALHSTIMDRYRLQWHLNLTPSRLFPGAKQVVETLAAADYLLAVATGKSRNGLNNSLEETGLTRYFHSSRCADETFSKPHPEMLELILDELGVFPAEALMIGDTEYDLQMAANAGVASLGVTYGAHSPERLARHDPLDCLDEVTAIPSWLQYRSSMAVNS